VLDYAKAYSGQLVVVLIILCMRIKPSVAVILLLIVRLSIERLTMRINKVIERSKSVNRHKLRQQ